MKDYRIVPLETGMAEACADIAATAPDPWRRADFETLPGQEHHPCFVAVTADGKVLGFACFLAVGETADLQLVAVAPEHRRQGVGEALLRHGFKVLRAQGVGRVLLELRIGNQSAKNLYEKLGFGQLAIRDSMYQNPVENGVLMAKQLR